MDSSDKLEFWKFISSSPLPPCYSQALVDEIKSLDYVLENLVQKYSVEEDQNANFSKDIKQEKNLLDKIEEVEQNEPMEGMCQEKKFDSTVQHEFSALKECIELNVCVETSKSLPSNQPFQFYAIPLNNHFKPLLCYFEPEKAMLTIHEVDSFVNDKETKSHDTMLGSTNFPFDPGGIETTLSKNHLMQQYPYCPPWKTCYPCIMWRLCYKIWHPGEFLHASGSGH